jgi:hypothetical protein
VHVTINANGLQQLAEALGQHHKLGEGHFTTDMLYAWADAAEAGYADGYCRVEIRSFEARLGAPVEIKIGPDGYDVIADIED